jgi:DNA-binding beta-propeller fold protein YncE
MVLSPDGKSAYVTIDGSPVGVWQYTINPVTGALSNKTPSIVATPGPLGMAVSSNSKSAYVANQDANTVSQYDVNPLTGALAPKPVAPIATGPTPYGLAVGPLPTGKHRRPPRV